MNWLINLGPSEISAHIFEMFVYTWKLNVFVFLIVLRRDLHQTDSELRTEGVRSQLGLEVLARLVHYKKLQYLYQK